MVGLDPSAAAVAKAKALGVDAREVDWLDYADPQPFDALVFGRSLHHMHDLEAAVAKTVGSLGPRGRVIVEDFAFAEGHAATAEWIRSLLRILQAAGRVEAPEGTQASILLHQGEALELWFADHHDIHSAAAMEAALADRYRILERATAPYLYRYLEPCLAPEAANARLLEEVLAAEVRAIANGTIQPLGRRWVAEKRAD